MLTLWSAARVDIWELAGVRQAHAAWGQSPVSSAPSAPPPASDAPVLTVGGPYTWVRHPIYLGWVLLVFGAPAMTTGRLCFATVSTLYLIVAIPLEERSLTGEFGAAYARYRRQVRWRLLPGVW